MLTHDLQRLGLTEGEAKVYEALVLLGGSKVGPVVKRAGVAYSNVYDVLNRLEEKGLVTHILQQQTKIFNALPPHRLGEFLDRRKEEIEQSRGVLAKITNDLEQLQRGQVKLEAEIFLGMNGLRTAYDILYTEAAGSEALYFYAHDASYLRYAQAFYQKEWPRMRSKHIRMRGISDASFKKTALSKSLPKFIKERYVPFPVPGTIDIVNDKILITSWSAKPVGILIHSGQTAATFRNYFESVWGIARG